LETAPARPFIKRSLYFSERPFATGREGGGLIEIEAVAQFEIRGEKFGNGIAVRRIIEHVCERA
jgi:hypothetical protein